METNNSILSYITRTIRINLVVKTPRALTKFNMLNTHGCSFAMRQALKEKTSGHSDMIFKTEVPNWDD